jgi:hypothetical protein
MMRRGTLLEYEDYRYLKISAVLAVVAVVAYGLTDAVDVHSFGRTWVGYALGIVSALIVVTQMLYGAARCCTPIRRADDGDAPAQRGSQRAKESWRHGGTLQGWLSAHVYLGAALLVTATLHTGFQFDWNVYTLAYVLLLLVVVSGFYGVYAYLSYPSRITQNLATDTLGDLLLKIAELDDLARTHAVGLPGDVVELVAKSCRDTRLGGTFLQQWSGLQPNCPTARAVQQVRELSKEYVEGEQPKLMRDLYSVLLHKERLVARARTDIMLNARLAGWLYVHVPLSIALVAALVSHIVAVFFYR